MRKVPSSAAAGEGGSGRRRRRRRRMGRVANGGVRRGIKPTTTVAFCTRRSLENLKLP